MYLVDNYINVFDYQYVKLNDYIEHERVLATYTRSDTCFVN